VNRDFRDLLAEFNAHGVEYLVVGAHALAAHGHVRATKDLDVWVRPDKANAKHIIDVLTAIDGVTFEEAWPARMRTGFADLTVTVLSKQHTIQNKRAAGRTQDLADIERLEGMVRGRRK
jgi:hypothetical protein